MSRRKGEQKERRKKEEKLIFELQATRTRTIVAAPAEGGVSCPELAQSRACSGDDRDDGDVVPAKKGRKQSKISKDVDDDDLVKPGKGRGERRRRRRTRRRREEGRRRNRSARNNNRRNSKKRRSGSNGRSGGRLHLVNPFRHSYRDNKDSSSSSSSSRCRWKVSDGATGFCCRSSRRSRCVASCPWCSRRKSVETM
jgi:hypothetical protein